jgi:zinc/manganese transport system permease protein
MTLSSMFFSPLFLNSWLGLLLLAFPCAWIGTTLVEKRLSLVTDTYSHALLPGVVVSQIFLGSSVISLVLGAWLTGLLLALITWFLAKGKSNLADSRFAFFSLLFIATGMALSYKFQSSNEILHLLFGNVLLFENNLNLVLIVLLVLVIFLFFKTKSLWSLWVIDPELLSQSKKNLVVWGLSALSLSTLYLTLGLYGVGSLMMVGLLVVPSLISRMHFQSLYSRLLASTALTVISMTVGLWISFNIDIPIGPTLVLTLSGFYFLSWIIKLQKPHSYVLRIFASLFLIGLFYPAISDAKTRNAVATTSVIHDIVQTLVAGEPIEAYSLQSPSRHEHEVSLSPRALSKLNSESLIIHWGFGLDDRAVKTLKSRLPSEQFCLASKDLPQSQDAHHWINAQHGIMIISNVEKCLSAAWPDQKNTFIKNSKLLQDEIIKLEDSFKKQLQSLDKSKIKFVTDHDAFFHLTKDYDITSLALYKNDHHQEPSALHFNQLLKKISQEKYAVFLSDQKNLNPLSRRLLELGNLKHQGRLYSDSLPEVAKNKSGYIMLLKLNFKTLLQAFKNKKETP